MNSSIRSQAVIYICILLAVVVPSAAYLDKTATLELQNTKRVHLERLANSALSMLQANRAFSPYGLSTIKWNTMLPAITESYDARIRVLDNQGNILGDTEGQDKETAEAPIAADVMSLPEIQTAIDTGHGVDIRNNEHGQETMFVAVSRPVTDKENPDSYFSADKNVTLVVSKELSELNSVIAKLHKEVIVSSSILIGIAGIFGIVVMRRINRKTREDSANLEHRVETRTEEIVMLQMLSSLLNTCGSLDEASKVISELIPKILPGSCGGISIFKASRNRLDLMVHWGDHFPSKLSMMPHDCWSLRKGHQHSTLDRGVLLPCDHWLTSSEHTICMPLLAQGETVGVLHIEYQDSIAFKETAHLREAIAEQTGLTLANIRLRQELREQARKDPMTGMYNRLHLMEELENTMHPDADGIVKCAVLMVDADHFKSFNDNFGHDAGDMVLKAIAGKIEDGSRETGLACRYGGEEFCVLMPGATIETAMRTGEAIRESISELDLSMNGLPLGKVSVSIGAAVAPEHTTDKYQIISLADAALYKAKENGRNCVEMYNPDPAKPALVDDTPVDDIRKVS